MDLGPHLPLLRWKIVTLKGEKWIVLECVIIHPFAKVVGHIKSSEIVAAELVVDDNDGIVHPLMNVKVVVSDQNVAFLQVVVAEHQ